MAQTLLHQLAPYEQQGDWYHFFIESDGNAYKITTKDINDAVVSSTHLMMPLGFHIIDAKFDYETIAAGATTHNYTFRVDANGKQGVTLLDKAKFTEVDVWIFGYFK